MSVRAPATASIRAALAAPAALGAQPKVTVGPAADAYEREADRVAAAVVAQGSAPAQATGPVQRAAVAPETEPEPEPEDTVQRLPLPITRLPGGDRAQRLEIPRIGESELAEPEPPGGSVAVPEAPAPSGEVPPTDTPGPAGLAGPLAGGVTLPADPEPGITEDDLFAQAATFEPIAISTGGAIADPVSAVAAEPGAEAGTPAEPATAESVPSEPAPPDTVQRLVAPPEPATRGPAAVTGPDQAELDALRTPPGGEPLPVGIAERVGSALGVVLSHVRVHRGAQAAQQAARIGARAFTLGSHVWLGRGERADDVALMAHELTHVVQQGHAPARPAAPATSPAPPSPAPATSRPAPAAPDGRIQREVRDYIPDRVLAGAARIADRIPGYRVLAFAVGENPITGEHVVRTGATLLHALDPILPERVITALRDSGSADRAVEWFGRAVAELNLSVGEILGLLRRAWDRFSVWEGVEGNIEMLFDEFGPLLRRVRTFVVGAARTVLELVFEAAVSAAGSAGRTVMAFVRRAQNVLGLIVAHPGRFVGNLMAAVGGGVRRFVVNIGSHLRTGFIEWITGTLSEAGVQMPEKWDLRGIVGLGLSLLGLTWANIRRKLVKQLDPGGERKVAMIEKGVTLVRELVQRGIGAVVPFVLEKVGDLVEKVAGGIVDFIVKKIVTEALGYLTGLFTGGLGTLIKIVQKLYDVAVWLMDFFSRVATIVETVLGALERIVRGELEPAAQAVERTLARFVPVLIGLVASLAGLGDLPKHIRNLIQRLSRPVDRMLDRVVGWIVGGARKLIGAARRAAQAAISWFRRRFPVEGGGESHTLYFSGPPPTAQVMIESTPTEIRRWLADVLEQLPADAPPPAVAVDAQAKVDELTAIIGAATAQGESGKDVAKRAEALKLAIEALLVHLRTPAAMPLTDLTRVFVETHTISLASGTATVGKRMVASPLTAAGPMGSPVSNDSGLWALLSRRRTGDGSYWIQAHLLNNNLHGPGDEPRNLTPLSRSANARHETVVESKVKEAVERPVPPAGSKDPPPVVHYEVAADYTGSRALPDGVAAPVPGAGPDPVLDTLLAEQQLARRFVCSAFTMKQVDGKWVKDDTRPLFAPGTEIRDDVALTRFDPGVGAARDELDLSTAAGAAGIAVLRSVPGLPDRVRTDDAVAAAVLAAAVDRRTYDDYQAALATRLAALPAPPGADAGTLAAEVRTVLQKDRRVRLFTRADGG